MIILLLGGVGTGKTLSVIQEIISRQPQFAITNFKLKGIRNYHRLKLEDLLIFKNIGIKKEDIRPVAVNWEFWDDIRKKHKSFSVYIDEIHNIISARNSMTSRNKLMSKWISQIRKICGDSENNHLFLISQKIRKIDVDFRELAHWIIECTKKEIDGKILIIKRWFKGIENYEIGHRTLTTNFTANKYFKYYNTNEIVDFGESEIYV